MTAKYKLYGNCDLHVPIYLFIYLNIYYLAGEITDIMEETVALLKSCVISKKGGVPLSELNDEFLKHVGEPIPYLRLGFKTICDFLSNISGLITVHQANGDKVLFVKDPKVTHIQNLIERQKNDYLKTKNKRYIRFKPYQEFSNTSRGYSDQRRNRMGTGYNKNRTSSFRSSSFRQDQRFFDRGNFVYNKSLSSEEEENNHPIVIESEEIDIKDVIYEPRIQGQQLIGDDFFLQIAIRNLNQPVWRSGGSLALHCGLCVSGQTIRDCIQTLLNVECISNRVIIMLGSVDVYNGATCTKMEDDMMELLAILQEKFSMSKSGITLCTIPPLANLSIYGNEDKILSLYAFNSWIRSFEPGTENERSRDSYQVIDFFQAFSGKNYATDYGWFQVGPRMVSGCKHPYVLWNKEGRKRVMDTLRSTIQICKTSRGPYSLQRAMKTALFKEPQADDDSF